MDSQKSEKGIIPELGDLLLLHVRNGKNQVGYIRKVDWTKGLIYVFFPAGTNGTSMMKDNIFQYRIETFNHAIETEKWEIYKTKKSQK